MPAESVTLTLTTPADRMLRLRRKTRPIVFTEFFETLAHINDLQQNLADHFQLELFSCRDIDPQTLLGENNDAQSDLQ